MTRVDFYVLSGAVFPLARKTDVEGTANLDVRNKHLAACKLIHKAYRLGHRVYLLTQNAGEAETLDQLLWTFAAGSFIPHQRGDTSDPGVPVVIGHDAPPASFNDVLVSLAPEVPPYYERFQRVAEIVGGDDADKQRARDRFRFYRDRGCAPETHTL